MQWEGQQLRDGNRWLRCASQLALSAGYVPRDGLFLVALTTTWAHLRLQVLEQQQKLQPVLSCSECCCMAGWWGGSKLPLSQNCCPCASQRTTGAEFSPSALLQNCQCDTSAPVAGLVLVSPGNSPHSLVLPKSSVPCKVLESSKMLPGCSAFFPLLHSTSQIILQSHHAKC